MESVNPTKEYKKGKNFVLYGLIALISIVSVVGILSQYTNGFHFTKNSSNGVNDEIKQEIIDQNSDEKGVSEEKTISNETEFLKMPEGFSINIFARELGKVRAISSDINGNLYTTVQDQGKLVVLKDADDNGISDLTVTLLSGLSQPNGLEIACPDNLNKCLLFLAETNRVTRYDLDPNTFDLTNSKVIAELPLGGLHVTRSILLRSFNGINYVLISVGSSCNVCEEKDERRAKILITDIEGNGLDTYAEGLRNSVFMTYNPKNGDIYATEMGRDYLGDNVPSDEINLVQEGKFYGWPYCFDDSNLDATFDTGKKAQDSCRRSTNPLIKIQAHSAPLGLRFMRPSILEMWGQEYDDNLFVAYHGSWNRTEPTGYKIVKFKLNSDGQFGKEEDFITGWLSETNEVKGRPVDIYFSKEGEMFISDDKEGRIFRVTKN